MPSDASSAAPETVDTTAASSLRPPIPRSAWVALAVSCTGYVLVGFNSTATNIAFGDIADSFPTASESQVSWVATAYFIATAAFLPLGGRLADRYGRRLVFLIGVAGFICSAGLSAFSPSLWTLVAARTIQAVAGALVVPSSLALVLPEFPPGRRATAVSAWAAAGPLSGAIAPSTAAAVLGFSTWRVLYGLTAPVAAVTLVLGMRYLRETKGAASIIRLDFLGAVLGTVAVALIVLGISVGPSWGWTSPRMIGVALVSALMVPLFVRRCQRHPEPLMNLRLFRVREVWVANLVNFLLSITSLGIWLVWPLYLGEVWGYSKVEIGWAITVGPLAAGPSALLAGRVTERFGHRLPITLGSGLSALAILWAVIGLTPEPDYWRTMVPSLAGFGIGWGMASPSLNSWALDHIEDRFWGEANATFNALRNVAAAIGVAGAVAMLGSKDRPDLVAAFDRVFFAFFVPLAAAFVAIVLLHPRRVARHDRLRRSR